ncbi:competence protein ComK [Gracilibacillus ureilyticus]
MTLNIIKSNCLEGGARYEVRKEAVIHRLTFHHKPPISISPH